METLISGTSQLGISLNHEQLEQLQTYYQELICWNTRMNLTAIVEYEEVMVKHFLDSYSVSPVLPEEVRSGGRLIDVGSGGGVPGIPLKVAFPSMDLTLLDSVGKKTRFLQHLVETLKLNDVEVCTGRAEELAHEPRLREGFDSVISRGVAAMRVLTELTLPYCRIGGTVITMKKGDIGQEMADASHSLEVLGGRLVEIVEVNLEGLRDGRLLVVVEKVKPTPAKFPRRPGLVTKHPL